MMQMRIYIDEEEKKEKRRLRTVGGIILWILMIGVSIILASRSLVLMG